MHAIRMVAGKRAVKIRLVPQFVRAEKAERDGVFRFVVFNNFEGGVGQVVSLLWTGAF
jgi:hypothetical protein